MYTPQVVPTGTRYSRLIEDISQEFPGFRIVRKDRSALQRAIHYGLLLVTLGGMRRYLHGYQTTIGKTVYVTADWEERDADERYVIMRHERVHLRQFRRLTLPGMAMVYLLLPMPMVLAYGRTRLEQEAYAETLRATVEVYGRARVDEPAFRKKILGQFLGPAYGWMWPFRRSLDAWYDAALAALDAALLEPSGGRD